MDQNLSDLPPKPLSPYRKRLKTFIKLSANSEAEQRLKGKAKFTSRQWRKLVTSVTAKQSCSQGTSSVTLSDLAAELNVTPGQLQPLLDHEYLRRISLTEVIRPLPAAMDWLRTMFQPLTVRPWLTVEMVAQLSGIKPSQLRTLCLMYDIPLQLDPVFGELMSVGAFHRFFNCFHHLREPSRFDRQALLRILHDAIPANGPQEKALPDLPFSKRLDMEIRRIARLPEPDRTFRATALLEAYRDAKGIADAFARYKGLAESTIRGMAKLEKVVERSVGPIS